MPCASYQWISALHILPLGRRTFATPLSLRHRPDPYCFRIRIISLEFFLPRQWFEFPLFLQLYLNTWVIAPQNLELSLDYSPFTEVSSSPARSTRRSIASLIIDSLGFAFSPTLWMVAVPLRGDPRHLGTIRPWSYECLDSF